MVTMSLPNHEREKRCYEKCEELIVQLQGLGRELEDIALDHGEAGVENVARVISELKQVQNKLAVIGLNTIQREYTTSGPK